MNFINGAALTSAVLKRAGSANECLSVEHPMAILLSKCVYFVEVNYQILMIDFDHYLILYS
jgi:hypothetical protein